MSTTTPTTLMLGITLIVCVLTVYLRFLWRKRKMIMAVWNMQGPMNLPILGASYKFMTHHEKFYDTFLELQHKYSGDWKMWLGSLLVVSLNEPEHIHKVLSNPRLVEKEAAMYKHVVNIIGAGLLQAPVDIWKKHRKPLMASFSQKTLDSFVEVFNEKSAMLTTVLENQVNVKYVDIFYVLSRCTIDIIMETGMSQKMNLQTENDELVKDIDKMMVLGIMKIFQMWNHIELVFRILGYRKKLDALHGRIDKIIDTVVQDSMRKYGEKNRKIDIVNPIETDGKRRAIMDFMIESGEFSAIEIRDEITMMIFAGTDTTASTMTFLVTVLGIYPDIQNRVYEEILQVVGSDRPVDPSDIPKLIYMDRVIKETLRLFPVGYIWGRHITEDVDMGDYILPKGAGVHFGIVGIHRNPKYWPDPYKFDPDRFLPEEVQKRHPCAYLPFSYGPRNCIGKSYGTMSMKVMTVHLLQKFCIHSEYKSVEDVKLRGTFVLRLKEGSKTWFTRRGVVETY